MFILLKNSEIRTVIVINLPVSYLLTLNNNLEDRSDSILLTNFVTKTTLVFNDGNDLQPTLELSALSRDEEEKISEDPNYAQKKVIF
mgnify:CR=1 FL=1